VLVETVCVTFHEGLERTGRDNRRTELKIEFFIIVSLAIHLRVGIGEMVGVVFICLKTLERCNLNSGEGNRDARVSISKEGNSWKVHSTTL
jgi:hypothetical protein